jgi:hypothetical protein
VEEASAAEATKYCNINAIRDSSSKTHNDITNSDRTKSATAHQ